ncbi:STAS-like domain-containing protein [Achromobacter aegrifaciens]|uniref:STAS-like domain-containing protein n=1 Tax=Achromobacter aegrifaciens TaxID=1287736 RepID=UPI0027BAD0B7|nr:STAS-like domain-containing protein [Achromobacter aegrifaciens]WLW63699.1 STAS-like domain-containing protein [Achromobacter aegrifaciens]
MGTIRLLEYVPHCYNGDDGRVIRDLLTGYLKRQEPVTVSFSGVQSVPSSFINVALISLLSSFSFEQIRRQLRFVDTTSQINEMIRTRFNFELHDRAHHSSDHDKPKVH